MLGRKSLIGIIALISIFYGCSALRRQTISIKGRSMMPTIQDGEKVRIERLYHGAKFAVKRGDIVMYLYPKDTSKFYVHRLVGMPKETVAIREGKVLIDGKELTEPYVAPQNNLSHSSEPPLLIPEGYYFVMGDNRDLASDSRAWGLVPDGNIQGKVIDR